MADQKSIKDLEAELAALGKQLLSLSQQIDSINSNISKVLQSLQSQVSKQKKQELADLELQELALENQYLETRKKHFELKRKVRATVISLLKEDPKNITPDYTHILNETTIDPVENLMDEEDETLQQLSEFGNWEIDDNEIKIGTDSVKIEDAKLGSGSFGTVFRGMCRGKEVAIKVLRQQSLDDKTVNEFKRECKIMSTLKHPNLLLFMGACTQPGKLKIVTELAANGSVEDVLKNKQIKLSFRRKMKIAEETASAMNWLHCMKPNALLHLDLKPANLLLTREWRVKIADFGLSQLKNKSKGTVTDPKIATGGTPLYMPPEMFKLKPEITEKCDVYAFGVILWQLLTEKVPFEGKFTQTHQLVEAVTRGERPAIPNNTPKKLRELIEQCWHQNPEKRPTFQQILDSKIFDDIVLEAVTRGNEACMNMWKSFGPGKKEIPWQDFATAFAKLLHTKYVPKDIRFQCLATVLNVNKHPLECVTLEAFENFLKWFGPIEGAEVLDQLKNLLEQKYVSVHSVSSLHQRVVAFTSPLADWRVVRQLTGGSMANSPLKKPSKNFSARRKGRISFASHRRADSR